MSRCSVFRVFFCILASLSASELASDLDENQTEVELPKSEESCSLCPVRLLDVASAPERGHDASTDAEALEAWEGLRLSEEGLEYLARQRSPLFLVPMLGVYRGGKSLLLNRLMGLHAPYNGGFGVGHGQQTHTRGIFICAETLPDGQGTIVWMDTEGLFSSEDARSSYGPKIFSLALLFSSTVLLNNVKVLNDQFFAFFSEQQQVARVLRQGLVTEGIPQGALLPGNLSVVWVLQQPISFDATAQASRLQLEAFLSLPGDETRERVMRDFNHLIHEVPAAAHDVRLWSRLDTVSDEELIPEYIDAASRLREMVLQELKFARPIQASSVAPQLRMYVELVQHERFSGTLAKEAFEDAEIGRLCDRFVSSVEAIAGDLPSTGLEEAFQAAQVDLESLREQVIEDFHLDASWTQRLQRCLQDKILDFERRNSELVLSKWQTVARELAEEGDCFFLDKLARILQDYSRTYGKAFSRSAKARAVEFGSALQRTRLVQCVRLRDFLLPFGPWLSWPICSLYLRNGAISGLVSMALHGVILAGVYVVLQLFNQLPAYLDVDYPVLRAHPILLSIVMRAPPRVPWSSFSRFFGLLGALRSVWKLLRYFADIARSAGRGQTVGQLTNLELKLNMLLKRSEAVVKRDLIASAVETDDHLIDGKAREAIRALIKGLVTIAEVGHDDLVLSHLFEVSLRRRAREVLEAHSVASSITSSEAARRCRACREEETLTGLALAGNWDELLPRMAHNLQLLSHGGEEGVGLEESSITMLSANSPSPSPVPRRQSSDPRAILAPDGMWEMDSTPSSKSASSQREERRMRPHKLNFDDGSFDDSLGDKSRESALDTSASLDESYEDDVEVIPVPETSWLQNIAFFMAAFTGVAVSAAILLACNENGMLPSVVEAT